MTSGHLQRQSSCGVQTCSDTLDGKLPVARLAPLRTEPHRGGGNLARLTPFCLVAFVLTLFVAPICRLPVRLNKAATPYRQQGFVPGGLALTREDAQFLPFHGPACPQFDGL